MENIKLCNLAIHFYLTEEHIIRTFKKTYGITPHQYILQSKIRIAMIMLRSTKDSIEEKILDLQNKKKDLFNKVVSDDGNILTKLTNEELLSLFNIQPK